MPRSGNTRLPTKTPATAAADSFPTTQDTKEHHP